MILRLIPVGSSRHWFAVVGPLVQVRSFHLLGKGSCVLFGSRVGSPCFHLWIASCMARFRRRKFGVFCNGSLLRSDLYIRKFGRPVWHCILVVFLRCCFAVRAFSVLVSCCCPLLRHAVVFGTQPICVRKLRIICNCHRISFLLLVVRFRFFSEQLACLGLLVSG